MPSGGRRSTTWTKDRPFRGPGRPRGSKDRVPRGLVRELVLAAVSKGRHEALKALRRNLKDPRRVLQVLELAARLNGELGMGSQQSGQRPVTMMFRTSLDPEEFRRRALARDAGKPEVEIVEAMGSSVGRPEQSSLPASQPIAPVVSVEPVPERVRDYHFGFRRRRRVMGDPVGRARRYAGRR